MLLDSEQIKLIHDGYHDYVDSKEFLAEYPKSNKSIEFISKIFRKVNQDKKMYESTV